jgi:hypothetical protein
LRTSPQVLQVMRPPLVMAISPMDRVSMVNCCRRSMSSGEQICRFSEASRSKAARAREYSGPRAEASIRRNRPNVGAPMRMNVAEIYKRPPITVEFRRKLPAQMQSLEYAFAASWLPRRQSGHCSWRSLHSLEFQTLQLFSQLDQVSENQTAPSNRLSWSVHVACLRVIYSRLT